MTTTTPKTKIELSGGFHGVGTITILWDEERGISDHQYKRIQKHFCGCDDCTCGGVFRNASVVFVDEDYPKWKEEGLRRTEFFESMDDAYERDICRDLK